MQGAQMTRMKGLAAVVAAAFVGAGTAAGILGTPSWASRTPETVTAVAPVAIAATAPGAAQNYRAIVKAYGPAVVGVTVEGRKATANMRARPGMPEEPFFEFFRGLPNMPQMPRGGAP